MDKPRSAADTLKASLRKRLRARINMKSAIRSGGGSHEAQSILEKFNDDDDEKASMLKDIQKDVKGMRQKDAKKYLKRVTQTMSNDDTNKFCSMMKDKLPGQQSHDLVNYVKRTKTTQKVQEDKKPHINPETVYVPSRLLSQEQKVERLKQPQKKKKGFSRVNIHVPKLAELRNHPGLEEVKESTKEANLTYVQRLKMIQAFDASKMKERMQEFMLEASDVVEVLKIEHVEFLSVPDVMEVPESKELVPTDEKSQQKGYIYKRDETTGKTYRLKNAHQECVDFVKKLSKIRQWLSSLQKQKIPWRWLCDVLNDLGIVRQQESQGPNEYFRVMCHEYKKDAHNVSVPMVPFVKIRVSF